VVRDVTERQRAEQLQRAVYRIAATATLLTGLPEMLGAIHTIVAELLPAANFYVALYDEPAASCGSVLGRRARPRARGAPAGRGLTDYVLRIGTPLLVTPEGHRELERLGEVDLPAPVPRLDRRSAESGEQTVALLVVQTYAQARATASGEGHPAVRVHPSGNGHRAEAREPSCGQRNAIPHAVRVDPQAMWVYDNETLRFLAVNGAALRRYGYSREEFLGMMRCGTPPSAEHARFDRRCTRSRRAFASSATSGIAQGRHDHRGRGAVDTIDFAAAAPPWPPCRTSRSASTSRTSCAIPKDRGGGQLAGGIAPTSTTC